MAGSASGGRGAARADSATSDIPMLPLSLAPNSAAENASTYVSRATPISSASSRRAAASRRAVASRAAAGDERELRLQQVDLRALELFERPGVRNGQQAASHGERAGLDTDLSCRERTFTAPRRVRGQRDGTVQQRRRGGGAAASLRPGGRPLKLAWPRPRPVRLPRAPGATRGDPRRNPARSPPPALRARAAGWRVSAAR